MLTQPLRWSTLSVRRSAFSCIIQVVIKPTFPGGRVEPVFADKLARAERDELARKLEADPMRYVAQEQRSPCLRSRSGATKD